MFTKLYLTTTDPRLPFSALLRPRIMTEIWISVIVHTILYVGFFNLASYIFLGRILSTVVNVRMFIALILIMFFGYFARYFHVKEIYKAYDYNVKKTRKHVDKLYIGWIFIA
jgi:hypothetical protein